MNVSCSHIQIYWLKGKKRLKLPIRTGVLQLASLLTDGTWEEGASELPEHTVNYFLFVVKYSKQRTQYALEEPFPKQA